MSHGARDARLSDPHQRRHRPIENEELLSVSAEPLTEDLLRISLKRLAGVVAQSHPEFGGVLVQHLMKTCGMLPDAERAAHFEELGTLLIDLGRLYVAESEVLRAPAQESVSDGDDGDRPTLLRAVADLHVSSDEPPVRDEPSAG
ncbi:hypothetical protein ACVDFE_00030 [Lentzea chajnantorensis]